MNVEPLFTVAMLLALVVGFGMSGGSLRRRGVAISYCTFFYTFTERGPTGGRRLHGIGRQDVHLLCTIIKLLGGSASGARGCAA
jgi:hypothetical protein